MDDSFEETHLPGKKQNFSLLSNDYTSPFSLLSLHALIVLLPSLGFTGTHGFPTWHGPRKCQMSLLLMFRSQIFDPCIF